MRKFIHSFGISIVFFLCLLVIAEVCLRYASGIFSTYSERSGGTGYMSPFVPFTKARNLEYPAGSLISDVRKELNYTYQANEFGFFDKNPNKRVSGKLRILCIGDSFTHGIGAPQDSSWPKGLDMRLQQLGVEAEVINAGLQGSDPVYSMDFLENRLFNAYQPDIVLLAINTTDVYEVALRGGVERFVNDSTVRYRPAPWWEPMFELSHLVRGVVYSLGYNGYLLQNSDMRQVEEESINIIRSRLRDWVDGQNEDGRAVQLGLILHPLVGELKGAGQFFISNAFEPQGQKWFTIDMSDAFVMDGRLTPKSSDHYFWPIDQHHNSKGYWLFGELVANRLINRIPAADGSITARKTNL